MFRAATRVSGSVTEQSRVANRGKLSYLSGYQNFTFIQNHFFDEVFFMRANFVPRRECLCCWQDAT